MAFKCRLLLKPQGANCFMHVVYFHGFSVLQSEKAQLTQTYVAKYHPDITLVTPQIQIH